MGSIVKVCERISKTFVARSIKCTFFDVVDVIFQKAFPFVGLLMESFC